MKEVSCVHAFGFRCRLWCAPARRASGPSAGVLDPPSAGGAMPGRRSSWIPARPGRVPLLPVAALVSSAILVSAGARAVEADAATRQIRVGFGPLDVAVGAGAVWVTHADGRVSRIDPRTARPLGGRIRLPGAGGGGRRRHGGPGHGHREEPPRLLGEPHRPARRPGDRAADPNRSSSPRGVDRGRRGDRHRSGPGHQRARQHAAAGRPAPGRMLGRPIPGRGVDARAVAVGGGFVWVANGLSRTLSRIDVRSGRLVGRPIRSATARSGSPMERGRSGSSTASTPP